MHNLHNSYNNFICYYILCYTMVYFPVNFPYSIHVYNLSLLRHDPNLLPIKVIHGIRKYFLRCHSGLIDLFYHFLHPLRLQSKAFRHQYHFMDTAWQDIEIPSDHPPDLFPEIRIPHHCCPQTALLVRRHIHKAHNLPDLHRIDPRCILLGKTADFFLFHTLVPQMLVADLDRRRAKACVVYLDIIDHCQIQERLIRNLL